MKTEDDVLRLIREQRAARAAAGGSQDVRSLIRKQRQARSAPEPVTAPEAAEPPAPRPPLRRPEPIRADAAAVRTRVPGPPALMPEQLAAAERLLEQEGGVRVDPDARPVLSRPREPRVSAAELAADDPSRQLAQADARPAAAEPSRVPELRPGPDPLTFRDSVRRFEAVERARARFEDKVPIRQSVERFAAGVAETPFAGAPLRLAERALTPEGEVRPLTEQKEFDPRISPARGAGFMAGVVGEIAGTKGLPRAFAPSVPGRAGRFLELLGSTDTEAPLGRRLARGAVEGIPTDVGFGLRDPELGVAKSLAYGSGIGAAAEGVLPLIRAQRAAREGAAPRPQPRPREASARETPPRSAAERPSLRRRLADVIDPGRQAEIEEAFRDPMTGLPNQTAFQRARPRLDADPATEIIALDVRNLKGLNDIEGREVADEFLGTIGTALRAMAERRGIDPRNVFRAGGDEFAVAVPRGQGDDVARIAQQLIGERPIGDTELRAGIRAGVGETWHTADAAAQAAKASEEGPRFRDLRTQDPPRELRTGESGREPPVVRPTSPESVQERVSERAARAIDETRGARSQAPALRDVVESSGESAGLERSAPIDEVTARRVGMPEDLRSDVNLLIEQRAHNEAVSRQGSRVRYRGDEWEVVDGLDERHTVGIRRTREGGHLHRRVPAADLEPVVAKVDLEEAASPLAAVHSVSATLPDVGAFRQTAGGAAEAPRPSEIIRDVRQALQNAMGSFKVAEGLQGHRSRGGGTLLGFLKTRQNVLRMASATDVRVFAHEVGHALQKLLIGKTKIGGIDNRSLQRALTKPALAELEALGAGISDGSLKEGWAEYWRRFIDNPDVLADQAPHVHRWVTERLEAFPTVRKALENARDDWTLFRDADPEARVAAHISVGEDPRNLAIEDTWSRLRTDVIDHLEPVRRVTQLIREQAGIKGIEEEADTLARLANGSMGQAEHFLERGALAFDTLENTGPSLKAILAPVTDNLDAFRRYIVSRRAQELHGRDILTGFRPEDVDAVVTKWDGVRADFGQAFDALQGYNRSLLEYLRDAGVISDETLDLILEANKQYVPFQRVRDGDGFGSLGDRFGHLFSPVKRIKGSGKDIIDPLESIIRNTYAYTHLAAKQQVSQAIASWAGKEGVGEWIEGLVRPIRPTRFGFSEIEWQLEGIFGTKRWAELMQKQKTEKAGIDPHEEILAVFRPGELFNRPNVISTLQAGERRYFEIDPELWRALEGLDKEHAGMLARVLSVPSRLLRAGATLAPEFQLRNPIRDQVMAFVQSEYGYVPFWDMGRGMLELLRKGDAYEQWIASGGQRAALLSLDRQTMQRHVQELARSEGVANVVRNPLDYLRALSALMEDATRMGEFLNARAVEGTTKEGLQRSALASREISIDFARHGAKTAFVRSTAAFWNARIQGYDRLARAAKANPRRFAAKVFVGVTLPSALEYYVNRDDPEYWELPQWQRDLFWVLRIGETWVRFPKPFELGLVFGTLPQRIFEWMDTQDPEGMRTFGREAVLKGEIGGFNPLPTAIQPLLENATNYSFFLDRPIVSRSMERLRPEFQAGGATSEVARLLGRWAPGRGISPAKIDNLLYSYTGGLGRLATNIADVGIRAGQDAPPRPSPTLADVPGARGVVARTPGFSSESVERLYRQRELADEATQTVRHLEQIGEWEAAERFLSDPEQIRLRESLTRLNRAADQLASLRAQRDQILRDPEMSPGEKREIIDDLGREATEIARSAIKRELPGEG